MVSSFGQPGSVKHELSSVVLDATPDSHHAHEASAASSIATAISASLTSLDLTGDGVAATTTNYESDGSDAHDHLESNDKAITSLTTKDSKVSEDDTVSRSIAAHETPEHHSVVQLEGFGPTESSSDSIGDTINDVNSKELITHSKLGEESTASTSIQIDAAPFTDDSMQHSGSGNYGHEGEHPTTYHMEPESNSKNQAESLPLPVMGKDSSFVGAEHILVAPDAFADTKTQSAALTAQSEPSLTTSNFDIYNATSRKSDNNYSIHTQEHHIILDRETPELEPSALNNLIPPQTYAAEALTTSVSTLEPNDKRDENIHDMEVEEEVQAENTIASPIAPAYTSYEVSQTETCENESVTSSNVEYLGKREKAPEASSSSLALDKEKLVASSTEVSQSHIETTQPSDLPTSLEHPPSEFLAGGQSTPTADVSSSFDSHTPQICEEERGLSSPVPADPALLYPSQNADVPSVMQDAPTTNVSTVDHAQVIALPPTSAPFESNAQVERPSATDQDSSHPNAVSASGSGSIDMASSSIELGSASTPSSTTASTLPTLIEYGSQSAVTIPSTTSEVTANSAQPSAAMAMSASAVPISVVPSKDELLERARADARARAESMRQRIRAETEARLRMLTGSTASASASTGSSASTAPAPDVSWKHLCLERLS